MSALLGYDVGSCQFLLQEETAEIAVWGHHDCWVVAKCQDRRRLYVVLEHQSKEGLTDACRSADSFAHVHFNGLFD